MEKKAWKYLSVALEANLKNAAIQAHLSVIDRRKKRRGALAVRAQ